MVGASRPLNDDLFQSAEEFRLNVGEAECGMTEKRT